MKKREVRRGLDFGENYGGNTTMFFYQIQGKNYKLPQVASLGSSILGY